MANIVKRALLALFMLAVIGLLVLSSFMPWIIKGEELDEGRMEFLLLTTCTPNQKDAAAQNCMTNYAFDTDSVNRFLNLGKAQDETFSRKFLVTAFCLVMATCLLTLLIALFTVPRRFIVGSRFWMVLATILCTIAGALIGVGLNKRVGLRAVADSTAHSSPMLGLGLWYFVSGWVLLLSCTYFSIRFANQQLTKDRLVNRV